jgi:hypothetical protein
MLGAGFEKTVVEICSIVRGDAEAPANDRSTSDGSGSGAQHYHRKFSSHVSLMSKRATATDNLIYVMVSATLTVAVQQLAIPVMGLGSSGAAAAAGGGSFKIVDADNKKVTDSSAASKPVAVLKGAAEVSSSSQGVAKRSGAGAAAGKGIVCFDDGEDEDAAAVGGASPETVEPGSAVAGTARTSGTALTKDELVDMPSHLKQYYMTVTSKWRLAALLSFLHTHRTHATQRNKVVVFFATCDSVDYHSLLLRDATWPSEQSCMDFNYAPSPSPGPGRPQSAGPAAGRKQAGSGWLTANDSDFDGGTLLGKTPVVGHSVEALNEASYTGMMGPDTRIYRLHGNMPQTARLQVRILIWCAGGSLLVRIVCLIARRCSGSTQRPSQVSCCAPTWRREASTYPTWIGFCSTTLPPTPAITSTEPAERQERGTQVSKTVIAGLATCLRLRALCV